MVRSHHLVGALLAVALGGCSGGQSGESPDGGPGPTATRGPLGACERDEDCDDGVDCTDDRCRSGSCVPRANHGECDRGACDLLRGCVETPPCSDDQDCIDEDPCTTRERCDDSSRRCLYAVLDGDGDGFSPESCGGLDCDDDEPRVPRARDDDCDGLDNDCDGEVDEALDLQSSPSNCGACGVGCPSGVCMDGRCTECGGAGQECCTHRCEADRANLPPGSTTGRDACASASRVVETSAHCDMFHDCFDGVCEACGTEGMECCPGSISCWYTNLTCADGVCVSCGGPGQACCQDGGSPCGRPLDGFGASCVDGQCQACGAEGEPCCDRVGTPACADGLGCMEATCRACGGAGEPCCDGGCDSGLACTGGGCA